MLTGEYRVAIDEKGRISIPIKLKNEFGATNVILTKSTDSRKCLQLLKVEDFQELAKKLIDGNKGSFSASHKLLQMRVIAPAQDLQIDKAGRIMIPQSLRNSVGIELKNEVVVTGMINRLEIWSVKDYEECIRMADDPEAIEKAASEILVD